MPTQYFIGDFDGDRFILQQEEDRPLWIDFGFDNYAGVTFQNLDEPLFMGWAMNWGYANETPTGEYCGQMTLARRLASGEDRSWITRLPAGFRRKRPDRCFWTGRRTDNSGSIRIRLNEGSCTKKITLANALGQKLVIQVTEDEIFVDRTIAGEREFHEQYQMPEYSSVRVPAIQKRRGDGIDFDVSVLEILADDGLIPITMAVYRKRLMTVSCWRAAAMCRFLKYNHKKYGGRYRLPAEQEGQSRSEALSFCCESCYEI